MNLFILLPSYNQPFMGDFMYILIHFSSTPSPQLGSCEADPRHQVNAYISFSAHTPER